MTTLSIRKMLEADLVNIVEVHSQAFKGFFIEQMGPLFIKAYYKLLLAYEGSIAYVYHGKNGLIEGFVVGFVQPKVFYKKFIRSSFQFIIPVFVGIIRNPQLVIKILGNIRRIIFVESHNRNFEIDANTAELSSIAVISPSEGIGSLLIDAFTKDALSRALTSITLTTDSENNELVNNFYIKHGFVRNGLEERNGRKLWRYTKLIDKG